MLRSLWPNVVLEQWPLFAGKVVRRAGFQRSQ